MSQSNKFKKGHLYQHLNTMDSYIYIVKDPIEMEDKIALVVKWWNKHYCIFQPDLEYTEEVFIRKSQLPYWSEVI